VSAENSGLHHQKNSGHESDTQNCPCSPKKEGLAPTTISQSFDLKSGSFETLINLVNEGPWMTILPYLQTLNLSEKNVKNLRYFEDPEPAREISIVYNKSQLKLPIIEALSNLIEGVVRGAIKFENIQLITPK